MSLFKSALALSGGSARGLSHLGVIQQIEKRNLKFDLIVGSSMGAMVGGLYAFFGNVDRVVESFNDLFGSKPFLKAASSAIDEGSAFMGPEGFFNRSIWLFRHGLFYTRTLLQMDLVGEELFEELLSMLIPDVLIEELPVRFAAVAMDLDTGEEVVLTRGPLRRAIAASVAIPGIFPPVKVGRRTLVDGGWADNVPASPAVALGAHFVLAVDAALEIPAMNSGHRSALEILFRCNEITRILLTGHRKSAADVLIVPEIGDTFWADFTSMDHCMAAGRKAFEENLPAIVKQMRMRRLRTLEGTIHPGRNGQWNHPMVID
ncbi:MAG: patatin-like phospholipase family protein [Deltaproteobacteria bacterium]|jgi:NTE family protein|nr:patatin-like phospholipase family protein [Deltaproteobacteria bacterium]